MSTIVKKEWNPFTLEQWLSWLGATVIAAVSMMGFLYGHFQTRENFDVYKDNQKEFQAALDKRLDRMENKLDQLMTK